MSYLTAIEAKIGRGAADVDAGAKLSQWYGPNSLACHVVRPLDGNNTESYFLVGDNLCGWKARHPMFNSLIYQDGKYITQTAEEDALEHFIKEAGLEIIPGHNLTGLAFATLAKQDSSSTPRLYLASFDAVRYKGMVLPHQKIEITNAIHSQDNGILFSPTITYKDERKMLGRNFQLLADNQIDDESTVLAQHWLTEVAAQGLGVTAGLSQARPGIVPIFMEIGPSTFTDKVARTGDIIVSRISILSADDQMAFGNIEQFILGREQLSVQTKMLLAFRPLDSLLESVRMQQAKSHD